MSVGRVDDQLAYSRHADPAFRARPIGCSTEVDRPRQRVEADDRCFVALASRSNARSFWRIPSALPKVARKHQICLHSRTQGAPAFLPILSLSRRWLL